MSSSRASSFLFSCERAIAWHEKSERRREEEWEWKMEEKEKIGGRVGRGGVERKGEREVGRREERRARELVGGGSDLS